MSGGAARSCRDDKTSGEEVRGHDERRRGNKTEQQESLWGGEEMTGNAGRKHDEWENRKHKKQEVCVCPAASSTASRLRTGKDI